MRFLWYFTVFAIILAYTANVRSEEESVAASEVEATGEPVTLDEVDSAVGDDGASNREARQFRTFGFGGGGFYRPRPYYGGGFYRPRPYYGGGFYRPPPFYGGGFYRPRPYYGGFGFYG